MSESLVEEARAAADGWRVFGGPGYYASGEQCLGIADGFDRLADRVEELEAVLSWIDGVAIGPEGPYRLLDDFKRRARQALLPPMDK